MPLPIVKPSSSGDGRGERDSSGGKRNVSPPGNGAASGAGAPRKPQRPRPNEAAPQRRSSAPQGDARRAGGERPAAPSKAPQAPRSKPQGAPQNRRPVEQQSRPATPAKRSAPQKALQNPNKVIEADLPEGWEIDRKTGVKHRELPKTQWDPDNPGWSISHLEDTYDATYDLDSLASDFLGHLQVAPDKDEQKRLMEEKLAQKKAQDALYEKNRKALNEKFGDEDKPFNFLDK